MAHDLDRPQPILTAPPLRPTRAAGVSRGAQVRRRYIEARTGTAVDARPLGYRRHSTNVAADQLAWLVYQSGVSPESAGWESLSGADRLMSSLVAAQLASRFRASCEGDAGSAV